MIKIALYFAESTATTSNFINFLALRDLSHLKRWQSWLSKVYTHLKILLSVEHYTFGLDFPVFDIYFVTTQYNWNIFTYSY